LVRLILRDHRLYLQAGRQAEGVAKLKIVHTHMPNNESRKSE